MLVDGKPTTHGADPPEPTAPARRGWLRPKGCLPTWGLALLLSAIGATLLMALVRVLATPGMPLADVPLLDALRRIGMTLNQTLTLEWVPPSDRRTVSYLLLLPTAALLITIARLTFGMRVLGYRSVLIAAGFQEIGIVPGLLVVIVVVGIIALLRPTMRRVRLPLYARVSTILSVTACIMVAALFVGPWLRSELIWSLAFFPVIILAMIAETLAGTLARHSAASAAGRLGWTLVVALLLLALMSSPAVLDIALRFPELMLTQLLLVVLVSEYLDLRLLQDWQGHPFDAVARWLGREPATTRRQQRVAVVRNRWQHGVIARLGPAAPTQGRASSIQHVVDALRDEGYVVKVFEGDMTLLNELQKFLPPHPRTGAATGVVLNFACGVQGRGRLCHVPAMLEMSGVAYSGPDPIVQVRLQDRYALLSSLQQAGVPVPPFRLARGRRGARFDLACPQLVSARHEPDAAATLVRDAAECRTAVERIVARHGPEFLVEAWCPGAEFRVALLGNSQIECLPLLQVDAAGRPHACPPLIDDALADRIRACARDAYRAAGCRDYARVDVRLTANGAPCVVGVRAHGILARTGSVAAMAEAAGLSWGDLTRCIVEMVFARNGVEPTAKPRADTVVPLLRAATPARIEGRDAVGSAAGRC